MSFELVVSQLAEQLLRMYGLEGFSKIIRPAPSIDDRLQKLTKIQADLGEALQAVSDLQKSAVNSKNEAAALEQEVSRLREDKAVAEELIKAPEEAFSRMLSRASAKGRGRGLLEGILVGLLTGGISSWLVWYFTAH